MILDETALRGEAWIRLASFFAVLAAMALWELAAPRRTLTTNKASRWFRNLGIAGIDVLAVRLLFPAGAVGLAWLARERGLGLLNSVGLPPWLELSLALLAFDFTVYLQHVVFHSVPALWRLHMVHHADLDFDVTTGNRFHPIEILLSMVLKAALIAALGPPLLSVLAFEVLLNATSMFNHGNVRISSRIDRMLRLFVVTPDMHRVHHSIQPVETNSNFGFNFPWWDRLLGTYRSEPRAGHEGMTIGLRQFREPERLTLPRLLALPFFGDIGSYPLAHPDGGRDAPVAS
jgi:sterol desaturase/sphingolipid hydroxylase (fatty acid hydroxylase superfamily)